MGKCRDPKKIDANGATTATNGWPFTVEWTQPRGDKRDYLKYQVLSYTIPDVASPTAALFQQVQPYAGAARPDQKFDITAKEMKLENGKGKFVIRDDFPFANWKGTQAFDAASNVAQDGQVIDYFVIADAPCKMGADGGRIFDQYSPATWESFRTTKLGKPHTICSSKSAPTAALTVKSKHV